MNKSPLVLFDVDGTLTEPRQPIRSPMIAALRELCRHCEIGLVTGSGVEYLKEQFWPALNDYIIRENCHLLPCNGTEYLVPCTEATTNFQTIMSNSMVKEIGSKKFNKLMSSLCILHAQLIQDYSVPLAGHFIQNRQSMVNWCPIGRNADRDQRATFVQLDLETGLRRQYLKLLNQIIHESQLGITAKLGGDTSFDIYPHGWDKTYALNHFDAQSWDFWFVGDRCYPAGNDYELFELLKHRERSFETSGPEETIELINHYILTQIGA